MPQQISLKCWSCEESFSHPIAADSQPTLLLDCPICDARCQVDLAPYRRKIREVLRGDEAIEKLAYQFPKQIPTQEPS